MPRWLQGNAASHWAHQTYRQLRDFLFQTEVHREVGLAAADGGEVPSGVLSLLDPSGWEGFQASFLHPREEPAGK
jgi:hypothetical protein